MGLGHLSNGGEGGGGVLDLLVHAREAEGDGAVGDAGRAGAVGVEGPRDDAEGDAREERRLGRALGEVNRGGGSGCLRPGLARGGPRGDEAARVPYIGMQGRVREVGAVCRAGDARKTKFC